MKAIVCVGIPASGKSSYSEKLRGQGWIELNRDYIRFRHFTNGERDWTKYKFNKTNESLVTKVFYDDLDKWAKLKLNVICSDTNLNPIYREPLIARLKEYGYEVDVKTFDVPLEEAWKRDANRQGGVGKDVIYNMYQKYLDFIGRKKYVPDPEKQDCVICDIDGTIAQMHNRKPFEWEKVGQDLPRKFVINMVMNSAMFTHGEEIIFLSGRDSVCRKETEGWLNKHVFEMSDWSHDLFMRAEGDCRKDTVIKEELFWEHIAPNYNVVAAVDDRPCMVRLWHELQIPNVICVADPWKEF